MSGKETKTEERLGKISKNLEEINNTIKEIWSKPESRITNRDVDIQKIQVLDNNYQSWFSFLGSIAAGGIIGLLILNATIYYEKILDIYTYSLSTAIIFAAILVILYYMGRQKEKHLKEICKLIDRIEKGEILPSINELNKK